MIIPDAKLLSREWAEARGWAVKVPESEPVEQLELLGIRRCISTEGTTAHLMYKWRGQPLSVYVLNSEDPRVELDPAVGGAFRSGRVDLVEEAAAPTRSWRGGGRRRSSTWLSTFREWRNSSRFKVQSSA